MWARRNPAPKRDAHMANTAMYAPPNPSEIAVTDLQWRTRRAFCDVCEPEPSTQRDAHMANTAMYAPPNPSEIAVTDLGWRIHRAFCDVWEPGRGHSPSFSSYTGFGISLILADIPGSFCEF